MFPSLGICIGPNFLPTLCRFVVIDLSAGPCTYGKIETEEGSVSPRTLPRLQNVMISTGSALPTFTDHITRDIFIGQLASLISTTVEHVVTPDVRYEVYFHPLKSIFHLKFFLFSGLNYNIRLLLKSAMV